MLVDGAPAGGGDPITVWESGAILVYLAEKHGRFLPDQPRARSEVLQWLFWQMASLGPMSGQVAHFTQYAIARNDYAVHRYRTETTRLYTLLDRQLAGRDWIAGDYSIADMASYPWVRIHGFLGYDLDGLDHLRRWRDAMIERPAVAAAYARMETLPHSTATIEERYEAMLPERGLEALGR